MLWGPFRFILNGFGGFKRLGHEADHSSSSDMEIKSEWSCTTISPCTFKAWEETLPVPILGTQTLLSVLVVEKVINCALVNVKK